MIGIYLMENPAEFRRIQLPDYLIEQRFGANREGTIDLYARIYSGELKAFYTPRSAAPADLDWKMRLLRHGLNDPPSTLRHTEIAAMDRPKIKAEIGKAARGLNADMTLLDSLVLEIPVGIPASNEPEAGQPDGVATKPTLPKRSPKQEERAPIILKAIEEAGLDRYALAKPKEGEREGDRAKVWRTIPNDSMKFRDFENAWAYILSRGIIRYKAN